MLFAWATESIRKMCVIVGDKGVFGRCMEEANDEWRASGHRSAMLKK